MTGRSTRRAVAGLAVGALLVGGGCAEGFGEAEAMDDLDLVFDEFSISVVPDSIPERPVVLENPKVEFRIDNEGDLEHELLVIETDLPAGELPTRPDGSVDEDVVAVLDRIRPFRPGAFEATKSFLLAGRYVFVCNLVTAGADGSPVSHFQSGMQAAFRVEEGSERDLG